MALKWAEDVDTLILSDSRRFGYSFLGMSYVSNLELGKWKQVEC